MSRNKSAVTLPLNFPLQAEGIVKEVEVSGSLRVLIDGRHFECHRAATCIVEPQQDDRVLICLGAERLWIVAILIRAQPEQPVELHFDGRLTISSSNTLTFLSPAFLLKAGHADCEIQEMTYRVENLSGWSSFTSFLGKRFESIWECVSQISHNLVRHTLNTEQVRAEQLDIKTSHITRLNAPTTLISSEELTRISGKQIHMG